MVAMPRLDADLALEIGLGDVLVAVERHQRGMADGDGVGAKRQGLGHIGPVADAAGIDQRDLPGLAHIVQRLASLADGRDARDAGLLRGDMRAGAGAALHAVDIDAVGAGLGRHAHVVIDAGGPQLQLDRDFAIGRLADLLDLEGEVVGAEPIGMAGRRALVDACRERAHLGHLVRHLLAHEMAAEADLAALADEELAGVRQAQMVRVEAVARLDALVEPFRGIAPLVGDHAALAGAGGGPGHGGAAGERDLGLEAQRPEAHAGDIDRHVQHQRPLGLGADHRPGLAFLAIALDDEAGQRAGQEGEIVPGRDLLEQREAAHAIAAELALDMDVVDDLRREHEAAAEQAGVALQLRLFCRSRRRRLLLSCHDLSLLHAAQRISFFSVGSRLS